MFAITSGGLDPIICHWTALSVSVVFPSGTTGPDPSKPMPAVFNGANLLEYSLGEKEPTPAVAQPYRYLGNGTAQLTDAEIRFKQHAATTSAARRRR